MTTGLFAGTFDPIHLGHVDIIARAAYALDKLIIAVASNPSKTPSFDLDQRIKLIEEATSGLYGEIEVTSFDGLVVDFAKQNSVQTMVRGVRNGTDFDYELQMAYLNRRMVPEIDTVFFPATEGYGAISSTYVRQIANMGGDLSAFVPLPVMTAYSKKSGA